MDEVDDQSIAPGVHPLPDEAYRIFTRKGEMNAVKVRRVMQITQDLSRRKWSDLRILDLGCGEGVYCVEAGLRGATVVGIDGRSERMAWGEGLVRKIDLKNVRFNQCDVRTISRQSLGSFNVVLFLGLLYHLDEPQVFEVLERVFDMCDDFMILDTHVSLEPLMTVTYGSQRYEGKKWREHSENASTEEVRGKLGSSLDNVFSFWPTKASLLRFLHELGFTSVYECHMPFEPFKYEHRLTLVAMKGRRQTISSYPWINDLTEAQIEHRMKGLGDWRNPWVAGSAEDKGGPTGLQAAGAIKRMVKRGLYRLGYEIIKI